MKRIALILLGGLLISFLNASPSAAYPYWTLANPSQVVAYQVGPGVITIASYVVTCEPVGFTAEGKPFVYDFKIRVPGSPILCAAKPAAAIVAYYQAGSPATVTVKTKSGTVTVNVQPAPPQNATTTHLPFH